MKTPMRGPLPLLAAVFVACAFLPCGAVADTNDSVGMILDEFLESYRPYSFGDKVRLADTRKVHGDLYQYLDIQVDSTLSVQGKYYPSEARFPRNARNHLLLIQTTSITGQPVTLWHEFVHHMIRLQGGEECGPEETYTELTEMRVQWLNWLVSFDEQFKRTESLTDDACNALVRKWEDLEGKWKTRKDGNLSGPFRWQDPGGTCKKDAWFTIDSGFIARWDQRLGVDIDINKIKPLYQWKLDKCEDSLQAGGKKLPPMDDLLQRMKALAGESDGLVARAKSQSGPTAADANSKLDAIESRVAGTESSVKNADELRKGLVELLAQLEGLLSEVHRASGAAIQARDQAAGEATRACQKAALLRNAQAEEEIWRLEQEISGHASRAEGLASEAQKEQANAEDAGQGILIIRAQADVYNDLRRSLASQIKAHQDELNAAEASLVSQGELSAVVSRANAIASEAGGVHAEAFQRIGTLEGGAVTHWKNQLNGWYGSITTNVGVIQGLASQSQAAGTAAQRVAAIRAHLGDMGRQVGMFPVVDVDAKMQEAQSLIDLAKSIAKSAQEAAQRAKECAAESGIGTPGATDDWEEAIEEGEAGSESGSGEPSHPTDSAGEGDRQRADGLIDAAATTANPPICDYKTALGYLDQAYRLNPSNARIAEYEGRMRALHAKQTSSVGHFQKAYSFLDSGNYNSALYELKEAGNKGSPCERSTADTLIGEVENQITRIQTSQERAEREESDRRRRETAAQMVDVLINLQRVAVGGATPPPAGNTGGGVPQQGSGTNQDCCSINAMQGVSGDVYWGLFVQNTAVGCRNYVIVAISRDAGISPQQYGAQTGMAYVVHGSRSQVDARAAQLCPSPVRAPGR